MSTLNFNSESETKLGKLIVLEGADGVGKSTQVNMIMSYCREKEIQAIKTLEPGSPLSPFTRDLRDLLFHHAYSRSLDEVQQGLLFFIDHYTNADLTRRRLERGITVISDRWGIYSALAYDKVKTKSQIDALRLYMQYKDTQPVPDLIIQIHYTADVLRERLEERTDKQTKQSDKNWGELKDLHNQLAQGYVVAKTLHNNWHTIAPSPSLSETEVFNFHIKPLLDELFSQV